MTNQAQSETTSAPRRAPLDYSPQDAPQHPCRAGRIYLQLQGRYISTDLLMCPACGDIVAQPQRRRGKAYPWHDGEIWYAYHNEPYNQDPQP